MKKHGKCEKEKIFWIGVSEYPLKFVDKKIIYHRNNE